MIKRIQIAGLRNKSFNLELGAVTLVLGENAAGKTTIADAIRWLCLGYIPGMDKPPRGWAELLGPTGMASASLTFGDGHKIERSIGLEKGSVKVYGQMVELLLNVLTLDPAQFFLSTGPKKAQMVAEASSYEVGWKLQVPEGLKNDKFHQCDAWPSWIGWSIDWAKARRAELADQKKTFANTIRGLEHVRGLVINGQEQADALKKATEKLGRLKQQIQAVDDQITRAKVPKVDSVKVRLEAVQHKLADHIGETHEADTIAKRLKDCEKRLKEARTAAAKVPNKLQLGKMRIECGQAGGKRDAQQVRWEELAQAANGVEAKYAKLKKMKKCPTCGTKGAEFSAAVKAFEAEEVGAAAKAAAAARDELLETEKQVKALGEAIRTTEGYIERLETVEAELLELQQEEQLVSLWKEHDDLVELAKKEQAEYDLQALHERRYDIECELEELMEANEQLERDVKENDYHRGQKRQLAEIEARLVEAESGWDKMNAQVNELELLREKFTAMSLEPVLKAVNTFTKGIFKEPLGLDGAELGRMVSNRWVPLGQFSGAEQAVAMAALTCALSPTKANLVLADELSAFDDGHLETFVRNVGEAIKEGLVEQFIGFSTPRKGLKASQQVKVISL